MFVWFRTEASFDQHVLDRLTGNLVTKPPHRLDDLGVAPTGLFSDSNDCVTNAFLHARPTRFCLCGLGPLIGRALNGSHPFAKGRIAKDRDQPLDQRTQLFAMFDQRPSLLIAEVDPIR
jgi:hypothetical protein